MLLGFEIKNRFFSIRKGLLFCARFLVYRCKHSESKPDVLQYFNSLTL